MRYKHIIFDFDGVLAETNEIRFEGFMSLFEDYPKSGLQRLTPYLRENGGLSRYEKIRYFLEEIRHEKISFDRVQVLARQYSELVTQKVIAAPPVEGSLEFLNSQRSNYDFAVVSSSDEEELKKVCRLRGIDHFFARIFGSPSSKA